MQSDIKWWITGLVAVGGLLSWLMYSESPKTASKKKKKNPEKIPVVEMEDEELDETDEELASLY